VIIIKMSAFFLQWANTCIQFWSVINTLKCLIQHKVISYMYVLRINHLNLMYLIVLVKRDWTYMYIIIDPSEALITQKLHENCRRCIVLTRVSRHARGFCVIYIDKSLYQKNRSLGSMKNSNILILGLNESVHEG
jgi:hypothetical protein